MEFPQDSDYEIKICTQKVYQELSLGSIPRGEWKIQELAERSRTVKHLHKGFSIPQGTRMDLQSYPTLYTTQSYQKVIRHGVLLSPYSREVAWPCGGFLSLKAQTWYELNAQSWRRGFLWHTTVFITDLSFAFMIPLWVLQVLLTQSFCRLSPGI